MTAMAEKKSTTGKKASTSKARSTKKPASKSGAKTASKSGAKKSSAGARSASKQGSSQATAGLDKSIEHFRDSLEHSITLSRDRLQDVVDDAVHRGRMTRGDAEKMVTDILSKGRRQTDSLLGELERVIKQVRKEVRGSDGAQTRKRAAKSASGTRKRTTKSSGGTRRKSG